MLLPTESKARKNLPMTTGGLDYFPLAFAGLAKVSKLGNDQHNPGQPMHWARDKSTDHADCILRHLVDRGTTDEKGIPHVLNLFWRAGAMAQLYLEQHPEFLFETQEPRPPAHVTKPPTPEVLLQNAMSFRTLFPWLYKLFSLDAPLGYYWQRRGLETMPSSVAITYLAGPMRGYPDWNQQAFMDADAALTRRGYQVINPWALDKIIHEHTGTPIGTEAIPAYMSRDLSILMWLSWVSWQTPNKSCVHVLPEWEASTGATAEIMAARWGNLRVRCADTDEPLQSVNIKLLQSAITKWLNPDIETV